MSIPSVSMLTDQQTTAWKNMKQQRALSQFCDITFQCNGGEVSAHKCVLASVSEFFRILFTSPISTSSSSSSVVFDDFAVGTMTLLLDAIYSEVDVEADEVVELMRLAEYVQLDWLVDQLVQGIRRTINETNVCEWYDIATECGIRKLKFLCKCYLRENKSKLRADEVSLYFDDDSLGSVTLANHDLPGEVVLVDTANFIQMNSSSEVSSKFIFGPSTGKVEGRNE